MPYAPGHGRTPISRIVLVSFVVMLMAVVLPPVSGVSIAPAPVATVAAPVGGSHLSSVRPGAPSSAPLASLPSASGSGPIFYANETVPQLSRNLQGCTSAGYLPYYVYNYCYPMQYNPSVVTLGNGAVGLSYEVNTNASATSCRGVASNVHTRIAWAVSSTNGSSWGTPLLLGNDTCTYLQAIEPSFASSGPFVYGAFIEENQTYTVAGSYTYRTSPADAIGFIMSGNNGSSFTIPTTLSSAGNLGHPVVAAYGDTVYVLYTDLSNSTTSVSMGGPGGYCSCSPPSLKLLYSNNTGRNWFGPYTIPGLNATSKYLTMGGDIAVNKSGTVAVSYFTQNKCVITAYSYCYDYGTDLQVITSSSNGTAWSPKTQVAAGVGEYSSDPTPNYYYTVVASMYLPQSSITFSPNGTQIDVAWIGGFHKPGQSVYSDYYQQAVWAASGPSNLTGTWQNWTLSQDYSLGDYDHNLDVSIGANATSILVAFVHVNETYGSCTYYPCNFGNSLNQSFSALIDSTSNGGATWSGPVIASVDTTNNCLYCAGDSWAGQDSSVGFTSAGSPLVAYAMPQAERYTYQYIGSTSVYNYTYPTELQVAHPYTGTTVTVDVIQQGLGNVTWNFSVQGNAVTVSGSQKYVISNVPIGELIFYQPGAVKISAYGRHISWEAGPPAANYSANGTEWINYTSGWLFQLNYEPSKPQYIDLSFVVGNQYYYMYADTYCYYGCYSYSNAWPPMPWYFPNDTKFTISGYGNPYPNYWNGTGAGSYTGNGLQANITILSVTNETAWEGGFGAYNVTFQPQALPSSSIYHFLLDGNAYSAGGTLPIVVTNLGTGSHSLGQIWANSSMAGYEYFGSTTATSILVPTEPLVNLSFALVDVAAPVGNVSFEANGLSSGSVWQVGFNGSIYSSSTPYINISSRPGTFPVQGFPVVANNGTAALTPSNLGAPVSLTTTGSYLVNFTSAYRVDLVGGVGGSVGPVRGALWYAPGAHVSVQPTTSSGYTFAGWTGTGTGSYTGPGAGAGAWANFTVEGAITETASFFPLPQNRFNLTFTETGISPGVLWTVNVGGVGYSTNHSTLVVGSLLPCGSSAGNYVVSVPYAYTNISGPVRFVPGSYPTKICTSGATVQPLKFTTQDYLTLSSTGGGVGIAGIGPSQSTTGGWYANGSAVGLTENAFAGYLFMGWNGSGPGNFTSPATSGTVALSGPVTELAVFAKIYVPPPPRYEVQVETTTTLAPGTTWSVVVNGTGYSSATNAINVTGLLAGTYPIIVNPATAPNNQIRYAPAANLAHTIPVTKNTTFQVSFQVSYFVQIGASYGGIVVKPNPGDLWIAAGGLLQINATPNEGFLFEGWSGSGQGSYTGLATLVNLTITAPIQEQASFAPVPPAAQSSSTSGILNQSYLWIALAAVALIIGAVVGLMLARRGRGGTPPPSSAEPGASGEAPAPAEPEPDLSTSPEGGT